MDLIYLLCFSDPLYCRVTDACITSLRGPGRFRGDIFVLTDGIYSTTRTDLRVCDASGILDQYVRSLSDTIAARQDWGHNAVSTGAALDPAEAVRKVLIKGMKAFAAPLIDHTPYDRIAFMDTDMIAISDVAPLMCAQGPEIVGLPERGLNTMLAESCGGTLLRPEERAAAGARWGVNAGFLCMKAEHFHRNMALWAREMENG